MFDTENPTFAVSLQESEAPMPPAEGKETSGPTNPEWADPDND